MDPKNTVERIGWGEREREGQRREGKGWDGMGWGREVEPIMSNSCIRPWSHRFLPDCILVNHFCLLLHDGLIGMSFAGFWQW